MATCWQCRRKTRQAYCRSARKAGKVWREHGALEYRECAGDDLNVKGMVPFPRTIRLKPGETVAFSWIVFKSRAHRDRVNAKVMKDPRLAKMMDPTDYNNVRIATLKDPDGNLVQLLQPVTA